MSIGFALFTEESGGTPIWSETQDVVPVDGYYSVLLGRSTPFPAATFKGNLWLELTVGGTPLTPRNPVASVPFAMTAANAQNLAGGSVSATTVSASNGLTCSGPARFSGPGAASGAGNISGPATTITGTGTHFLTELAPGDALVVGSESRLVVAIQSDTQLTIDSPFLTAPNQSAFSHQPAALRVDDSKGNPQLVVNARGAVEVRGDARIVGNVSMPNQSSVLASNIATSFESQNITFTKVPYGSVSHDRQKEFDTKNSRFVASVAGNYLVCAGLNGGAGNFWLELDFFVNDSRLRGFAVGTAGTVFGCGVVHLNAKDYLEIWTWHTRGQRSPMGQPRRGGAI